MSESGSKNRVLIIDDEPDIRELVNLTLTKMGLEADTAIGVVSAKKKLDQHRYDLILTDMRMPDGSGLDVVQYVQERELPTPIVVMTAYGNADQAVQSLKAGAFDYIQKPLTLAQLRTLVRAAIESRPSASGSGSATAAKQDAAGATNTSDIRTAAAAPIQDAEAKHPEAAESAVLGRLLGNTPAMQQVRSLIEKIAHSMVPVYIHGESGTGKEQAARSIHETSARSKGPFVAVNCGAIPENLMESEFFGYKKGSFTGADSDKIGHFQAASGGTLFLDEVADLPLSMQVKLLRAIQEKAVRRIGESLETPTDVRIISATHKDLAAEVAAGRFRQDLFYRLNVVTLTMPSLRDMRDDLPMYIKKLLAKHGRGTVNIEREAARRLLTYHYPGNFRELENILERALALSGFTDIRLEDLQIETGAVAVPEPAAAEIAASAPSSPQATVPTPAPAAAAKTNTDSEEEDAVVGEIVFPVTAEFYFGKSGLQEYLDEVERGIIENALQQTRYNRTQAAKLLGITFRSMRYRMERLGIE